MEASDLEAKAREAFIDDHFELAIDLYSQAIALNPNNADLFADRAQAYIKLQTFTEAVADANKAIGLDPENAKLYMRKGIACLKLEEYHTAKTAFEIGSSLAPGDSRFTALIKECYDRIAEEVEELPKQLNDETPAENEASKNLVLPVTHPSQETIMSSTKPRFRHEFYQQKEEVVVAVFAKGIPAENIEVDFGEQILSITIEVPKEEAYHFQRRLFGKIIPAECRYEVLSTKIEIRLAKAEPIHWASLEFNRNITVLQKANVSSSLATNLKPDYPSSKPKRVDWDKLEAEVKKEEKDEKLEGDAALNKFFREVYNGADEDTRRAMSKSFVESSGTVLSTNWKEVGSKKVEGSAPDGMELKKWEY